jgi:hypothetical protein
MANKVARPGSAGLLLVSLGLGLTTPIDAQHQHEPGMAHDAMLPGPLGIPHTRMGSGSGWLPDAAPMRAYHWMPGAWTLMLHGDADLLFGREFSDRGGSRVFSTNWVMLMAMRPLGGGNGLLHFHAMASAEPLTVGGRGYPLLLQSGETWQGEPLHDRQHPHDLLVELAGIYEQQLTRSVGVSFYGAPVGEPALGPVAFMHRPSAQSDPLASVAHHWQDATHITHGVLTGGVFTRHAKLEASWFNGREPDENRYDLDLRSLDSWSVRLLVNPNPHWSASAYYGFLKSPDADHADESERRFGASLLYTRPLGGGGEWSSGIVWGASREQRVLHSVVAETNLQLGSSHNLFGRLTYVRKSAEELRVSGVPAGASYPVYTLSGGYVQELGAWQGAALGIGARVSVNLIPAGLEPAYGTRTPIGFAAYFRLRPALQQ